MGDDAGPQGLPLLYDWTVWDGPTGVTNDRAVAAREVVDALRAAEGEGEGVIRRVALAGLDHVPVRNVAHVSRTSYGAIIWTEG